MEKRRESGLQIFEGVGIFIVRIEIKPETVAEASSFMSNFPRRRFCPEANKVLIFGQKIAVGDFETLAIKTQNNDTTSHIVFRIPKPVYYLLEKNKKFWQFSKKEAQWDD